MRERPYRLGLVLGRFQGLHIGHEAVIRKALSVCDRVIVMIGSADKEGTAHDPFSAKLRREMLTAVFPRLTKSGRVILVPLPDLGVGNVPAWGDYVIANAKKAVGVPECIVYGDEDKCRTWFPNYCYWSVNGGCHRCQPSYLHNARQQRHLCIHGVAGFF